MKISNSTDWPTHEGLYKCSVDNGMTSDSVTAHLMVDKPIEQSTKQPITYPSIQSVSFQTSVNQPANQSYNQSTIPKSQRQPIYSISYSTTVNQPANQSSNQHTNKSTIKKFRQQPKNMAPMEKTESLTWMIVVVSCELLTLLLLCTTIAWYCYRKRRIVYRGGFGWGF